MDDRVGLVSKMYKLIGVEKMRKIQLVSVCRMIFALLTLTTIVLLYFRTSRGVDFSTINFFSYFTNLSNIFACLVFLVGSFHGFKNLSLVENFQFESLRGAAVVCMILVGSVFNTLLTNVDLGPLEPWMNLIVHQLMPLVVVLDWILVPPAHQLKLNHIFWWVLPAALYATYSLIRGSMIGWYPYPFFNPVLVGGAVGVAIYCAGMFAALILIAYGVLKIGNRPILKTN